MLGLIRLSSNSITKGKCKHCEATSQLDSITYIAESEEGKLLRYRSIIFNHRNA